MAGPEQLHNGERRIEGAHEAAGEQAEKLRNKLERAGELSPERQAEQVEQARVEATKEAISGRETGKEQNHPTADTTPAIRRVTKQEKEREFKNTLSRVQKHLSTPGRVFSKVIHNPVVEKTSDFGAKTIARPNAILAGGVCAFLLSGVTYFVARTFGYPLSGFETIGAFLVGFLLGIIYDFLKTMITGRSSS